MKRSRIAVILVAVALFVFFAPVVPTSLNFCPPNAFCPVGLGTVPAQVSVSYYALGVGGRFIVHTQETLRAYQVIFWPDWICHPSRTLQGGYDCYQIIWSLS